jgi:hypothetical protein
MANGQQKRRVEKQRTQRGDRTKALIGKLTAMLEPRLEPHISADINAAIADWVGMKPAEVTRMLRLHRMVLGMPQNPQAGSRAVERFREIRRGNGVGAAARRKLYKKALRAEAANAVLAWIADVEAAAKSPDQRVNYRPISRDTMLSPLSSQQDTFLESWFADRYTTPEKLRLALRTLRADFTSSKQSLPPPMVRLLTLRGVKLRGAN